MDKLYLATNFLSSNHNYSISFIYLDKLFCVELERINRIKDYPSLPWRNLNIDIDLFDFLDRETNDPSVKNLWLYIWNLILYSIKKSWIDISNLNEIYSLNLPLNVELKWFKWKIYNYKHNYHHLFHAFSAFYSSNFDESVVLCIDHDWFDEYLWSKDIMHSIWQFDYHKYECLFYQEFSPKIGLAGIWALYEISSKICWLSEWTFMWLSSYWIDRWQDISIFELTSDWVNINQNILAKKCYIDSDDIHNHIKKWLLKIFWIEDTVKFDWIEQSVYSDFAYKIQKETENAIIHLWKIAYSLTWIKNISIAWWVWLNIPSNSRIIRELSYKDIFVQPASHDSWLSLGWLYYLYYKILWNTKRIRFNSAWIWFHYDDNEVFKEIKNYKELDFDYINENKYKISAELLSKWNIIWWVQWWLEFWPRALWFRSIFSWAFSIELKNKLNDIKWRERYRPLAPILLEEDINKYFDSSFVSPYMTMSFPVLESKKDTIIWAVHIDWTARYQSVNEKNNMEVFLLLKEYKKITWESLIINTSFNQNKEPIIDRPSDAIKMFLSTDMDYLVIWNYLLSKKNKYLNYKFKEEKYILNHNNNIYKTQS